jgi:hypothetical protein
LVYLWLRGMMAGRVQEANIDSPSARHRLKRGRQPHWRILERGKAHLGWQCWKGDPAGRWVLRRYIGNNKYRVEALGIADDLNTADGERVLSYQQAEAKGRAMIASPKGGKIERLTVRQAVARYTEYKRALGQPTRDLLSRATVHILPTLGDEIVAELTAEQLRQWLATMAAAPARARPKDGQPQYRSTPRGEEAMRARRASANRVLTMLKAALNHAFDEGYVAVHDAWGRKLKPFRDVETARVHYLSVAEAQRLINACDDEFRPLVRAALETGCRYGELTRVEIADFNPDAGTVAIRKSKTGCCATIWMRMAAPIRVSSGGRQRRYDHADW